MSTSNDSRQDGPTHLQPQQEGTEQERVRHSGEGAASALAQLKHQTRQHRRLNCETDDPAGAPGQ